MEDGKVNSFRPLAALLAASALALLAAGTSRAAGLDTLRISAAYTTHIIFSTDLTYADISNSSVVLAKIVEQNKNMLALKAREPFPGSCSVSALESNGTMRTFIVVYEEHPRELVIDLRREASPREAVQGGTPAGGPSYSSPSARLVEERREARSRRGDPPVDPRTRLPGASGASGSPSPAPSGNGGSVASTWKSGSAPLLSEVAGGRQHVFHIGCREYGIQVLCEDISSYSDITYFVLSLRNGSGISYDIGDATFVIESRKAGKRTVKYDRTVFPRSRHGKLSAGPGEYTRIAYSFDKMTLSKDQVLRVYLYEEGGQRNLVMTIDAADINRARSGV